MGRKEGQCSASVSGLNKRVKIGVLLLYSEGANGSGVSLLKKKKKKLLIYIGVQLINSFVRVAGAQQSDSAIPIRLSWMFSF